jgi:hypothetical protein
VDPSDEIPQGIKYSDFGEYCRRGIADYYVSRKLRDLQNINFQVAEALVDRKEWDKMGDNARKIAAMEELLIAEGRIFYFANVEFVRYDEELYRALVRSGAKISRDDRDGTVSLDRNELGLQWH